MVRFGDGLAVGPDLVRAAESAVRQATEPLGGRPPDLLCVFVSHEDRASERWRSSTPVPRWAAARAG
jgi:hypothetical protein